MANVSTLERLLATGTIRVERGRLFERSLTPKPPELDFGRIEGMLLGLAIGDALGITTEGMLPGARSAAYGEIRDYLPNRHTGERRGFPSDDTQLAFWTLEQLVRDAAFVPENVARRFAEGGRIFGIGATVRCFLGHLRAGVPWTECGPRSAGNGALMRIAPLLVPHLRSGGTAIWADTALGAMLTHNDHAAISSSLAFVAMLWELLDMSDPPVPAWWVERYVALARDLEGEERYRPRGGRSPDYRGPLWRYAEEQLGAAARKGLTVRAACDGWYSGAYLLETVPSVLYILMNHAAEPEEAIVRAVNDTKDNDTIAAIVGAAVGALHGRARLPARWIEGLTGRTTDRDDGRIFELIEETRRADWYG